MKYDYTVTLPTHTVVMPVAVTVITFFATLRVCHSIATPCHLQYNTYNNHDNTKSVTDIGAECAEQIFAVRPVDGCAVCAKNNRFDIILNQFPDD